MARVKNLASTCVRPVFVNGDHVVIRWVFPAQRTPVKPQP